MKEKYYQILIKLARKAAKSGEIPVSALIVRNNKIIAKAYNKRNKTKKITDHAEIIAIEKAAKKLKDWRLNDCDLYVTLKPCTMCESVINQSRIKNVYYILEKNVNKKEYYRTNYEKANKCTQEIEYKSCLNSFFQNKRSKNK